MSDEVGLLSRSVVEILPENILDIDTKSVKCFLCDQIFVTGDESFLLFNERIQSDGSSECPLAQILCSALDIDVEEQTAHSSLLCSACNDIVLEYESLEQKLFETRLRIITAYNQTSLKLQETKITSEMDEQFLSAENETNDKIVDNSNQNINNVQESSNDASQEIVKEEFNLVSNVFDSFEMIGGTAELQDDLKLFTVDENMSFDDETKDLGVIIYEEALNENEFAISDDQNNIAMNNDDSKSSEVGVIHSVGETGQVNLNSVILQGQNEFFSCSICDNELYLDAKSFSQHMYNAHKLRVNPCELCNNTFHRKEDLDEHVREDNRMDVQTIKYECEICNQIFDNFRIYRTHKRNMHSVVNKPECQECHKKFNCKTSLEEHMNMHYGVRPFSCEQCPKKFASKYSLYLHTKTHNDRERPHKCVECGKAFLTIQNLQQHKKIHSGKVFVCEICQKTFATQHNLDAHSIVHTGRRPFSCAKCGKTFARRAEIIDHERIHTGDRPFKCDICEMAFTQRSNLTAHKKTTHFNEKLHQCEICKRSFKRRRLLDYHTQAVHTGERPFKCETCGSSFVYPEHYKKHLRIHTGLKPFACEVCGKQFSSRDNRNAHRFVHSDKKPYECVECGAGFMRKPPLLAHMLQSQHANDTIIVNQPQITEGKAKTTTFSTQSGDISLQESIASENNENMSKHKYEEDVSNCESVSLETILPSGTSTTSIKSEGTTIDDNERTRKNQDIDDEKYLYFNDFDDGNHQTLTWADLGGDKD